VNVYVCVIISSSLYVASLDIFSEQDSALVTAYNNSTHHHELDQELATMIGRAAGTNQVKIPQFAINPFQQVGTLFVLVQH